MLETYIAICYLIGIFVVYDSLKSTKQLAIIDVVMFFMSPFSMINFVVIKLVSHFIDLNQIIATYEDK
jgi:hypothetical protein